jgi:anti-anti-sigma regulatory factor
VQDDQTLPQEFTIYVVGEWHARCLRWLGQDDAHGGALRLDASQVAELDTAGVQLLISLANGLARRDRQLLLVRPSATLSAVCTQLGAAFLLGGTTTPEAVA